MSNADYEQYEQHYGEDAPPKKRGGFNWLLGCGLGCGVMVLICCGGVGILAYQMVKLFNDSLTEVPEEIVAISDRVATFDRPDSFEPVLGAKFDIHLFGQNLVATGAIFAPKGKEGLFVLAEFGEAFAGNSADYLKMQMKSVIEQTGRNPESTIDFDGEPQEVAIIIRGEEQTFQFTRGKDIKNDQEYIQVLGDFPGEKGPAVVWGILPLEDYSEQDIVDIIQSIK